MKARVKATREVVSLVSIERHKLCGSTDEVYYIYQDDRGEKYTEEELDFQDIFDYWERLKHQYAGMAMQGLVANQSIVYGQDFDDALDEHITVNAVAIAHALVEKLKSSDL